MYSLQLADGCNWQISAETPETQCIAARLAEIMHLPQYQASNHSTSIHYLRLTPVETFEDVKTQFPEAIAAARRGDVVRFPTALKDPHPNIEAMLLNRCSAVIGMEAQLRGGMFIHGALAAFPAETGLNGILMCAPSGEGKTTASNRLPPPWVSLCDDMTLVVRHPGGEFWAHPWPTWSRYFLGETGECWDTPQAVPLRAIFFLQQAHDDRIYPLKTGHAVVSLTDVIFQVSQHLSRRVELPLARLLRCEWFENAIALAQALPIFQLQLTLTGNFWNEIEKTVSFSYPKERM